MDATLLIRGGQGTRISAAGSAFLPFARQLLQIREDAARETSAVHHGRTSSFRLGYSPFISQGLLREAFRAYKELVPEGADGLSNDGSATLAKMVRDGRLDAALVTLPVAGRELIKQVICTEKYFVCLRKDDPCGTEKSLSPASVSANLKIFVNRSQNPLFSDYVKRKLGSAGRERRSPEPPLSYASERSLERITKCAPEPFRMRAYIATIHTCVIGRYSSSVQVHPPPSHTRQQREQQGCRGEGTEAQMTKPISHNTSTKVLDQRFSLATDLVMRLVIV